MPSRLVAVLACGATLSFATIGCVSNDYVISKSELLRLSSLPASHRGAHVHVVQELGSRSEEAVDNEEAISAATYASDYADYDRPRERVDDAAEVAVRISLNPPATPTPATPRPWPARAWTPVGPRAQPQASRGQRGGGHGGGGNLNLGNLGGGGGGGGGDDLAVLAIVVVAVALMAAAGLAVTEGLRYDGFVQLHPEQPIHLKAHGGSERTLPLTLLTPADVATSDEGIVMDDEAYGFRFSRRRPLDRQGFAFKVDMGSLSSLCTCYSAAGLASNIQFGYFPLHRLGVLATLSLGGGTSPLDHTFQRHSANLEAQVFPLGWWRLHLGAFGHGGYQVARDELGTRTGPAWGGGAILEIALTTRLALTGRADYTTARTAPQGETWAGTTTLTAGLAIY